MRIISEFETQFKLGQTPLSAIELNLHCRDDITKFLLGIQNLSENKEAMEKIIECLKTFIKPKAIGRCGMSLWKMLILALLRQVVNGDYDRLCNLANNHRELRAFLGHSVVDASHRYALQTMKDNLAYLTEELLDKINLIIVRHGHSILDKRQVSKLNITTDSFVVKSNVHYPTDSNLLFDAIRSVITRISKMSHKHDIKGWRQSSYTIRKIKTLMRKATKLKRSTSKNEEVQLKRQILIEEAYIKFITECQNLLAKVKAGLENLQTSDLLTSFEVESILEFMSHADRQIQQLHRRVILKESIPHDEKVFSLFEPYTEWISKGKAGIPVEFGLKVCISTDQRGFILSHKTMQKQQDVDVAVPTITKLQEHFPNIYSASFDRGFYSLSNQETLQKKLEKLILPKKGKLSQKEKEVIKSDPEYQKLRKKHSSVESNINALECHALDRCPDKGIDHFKRYVSLSIVAHNVHKIGALVQKKLQKKENRKIEAIPIAA